MAINLLRSRKKVILYDLLRMVAIRGAETHLAILDAGAVAQHGLVSPPLSIEKRVALRSAANTMCALRRSRRSYKIPSSSLPASVVNGWSRTNCYGLIVLTRLHLTFECGREAPVHSAATELGSTDYLRCRRELDQVAHPFLKFLS